MKPTVSIIVPVYKVEAYIYRCVDSILNQTYTNFELILVNDGSPDNCGAIIDEYAFFDKRIMVLHKQNGGLSDARNYGMHYASGDYTMFIDSDDWIQTTMIESLLTTIRTFQADVVQSAFYYAHDEYFEFDQRYYADDNSTIVFTKSELMKELVINEKIKNFAWGKLYKTKLIKDIPFKNGVLFEDVYWAHQVMHRVNTYVLLNKPLYNYYQRGDSIVATYSLRNLDIIKGLKERHKFIEMNYPDLVNHSYKLMFKTHLEHYHLLLLNKEKDPEGKNRKELKEFVKSNYKKIKNAVKDNEDLYKQLVLFGIHPYFNISFIVVRKILRKVNITSKPISLERKEV